MKLLIAHGANRHLRDNGECYIVGGVNYLHIERLIL